MRGSRVLGYTGPPWLRYFTPAKLEGDLANARHDLLLADAETGDRSAARLAVIDNLATVCHQYPLDRACSKAIAATRLATLLCLEGEQQAHANAFASHHAPYVGDLGHIRVEQLKLGPSLAR